MSYLQLRFQVSRDRADDLNQALEELGALSITWENAGEQACFEAAYPCEPDWRDVYVTGLFDPSCESGSVVAGVNNRLRQQLSPQVRTLENQDWERVWMLQLEPRKYRGDLWVCPSWASVPDPRATNVMIDPGLAFGTGDHPTTALCLDWISENEWSGRTVLDYGCGSGILAIACLRKGADYAYGIDVDPRALSASTLNSARNGVEEKYEALAPGEIPVEVQADVVFANILANVLVELAGALTHATSPGGRLLLTGILQEQVDEVKTAFEASFGFEARALGEWCLLIAQKY